MGYTFKVPMENINWKEIKAKIEADDFDKFRSAKHFKTSFDNSFAVCFAFDGEEIIGKARVLSDQVCNAYIVDLWTYSPYRHQGVATKMMGILFKQVPGQHIYLFTNEETLPFYENLGMKPQGIGLGKVVGEWLINPSNM
jgi:predicted GNAT family acetyltransferase